MKQAVKRILWRILIVILILLVIYLLISNIDLIRDLAGKTKSHVVIDADAAHGVDDLFAIWRILMDGETEFRGLHSAQWRLADLDNDSTVRSNQEIHRLILEQYYKTHIPHREGSSLPLAYRKADDPPNAAAVAIIRSVQELPYAEKLHVLCLGSATNLAAAIQEKPEISGRIICYILGPSYDPARRAWNKNDPVTRLDLEAMDILLNDGSLELHLIPRNVASGMFLLKAEIIERMHSGDTLQQYILHRCMDLDPGTDTIACPGLSLVEAFLNPDLVNRKQLIAPPENTQRKLQVYTRIDAERMRKDFLKAIPQ